MYCGFCSGRFTDRGRWKAHFHYKRNLRCKLGLQKEYIPPLKKPRATYPSSTTAMASESSVFPGRKDCSIRDVVGPIGNSEQSMGEFSVPGRSILANDTEDCAVAANSTDSDNDIPFADDNEDVDMQEVPPTFTHASPKKRNTPLSSFKEYCKYADNNHCDLTPEAKAGVKLLDLLSRRRVPLTLYDEIFTWHLQHPLRPTEFIPRKTLLGKLNTRYNMEKKKPFIIKMELPHSKARIKLVCHDALEQIISILTDPRIKPDDYLFHNDDPLASPPPEFTTVSDIITGRSYRETYKALIQPAPSVVGSDGYLRRKVLLPVPFYMDGTVTGTFQNLPIEQLKLTLGIFKGETRDRPSSWRCVGYVKNYLPEQTLAVDILKSSEHVDFSNYLSDSDESDEDDDRNYYDLGGEALPDGGDVELGEEEDNPIPVCGAQDMHSMMEAMLKSYKVLQDAGGFDWDLPWKGKVLPVRFVPYVCFVKGDTVEHDKHCGSFVSRTKNIKQLCRYCQVPNQMTEDAYKDFPLKSQELIEPLCKAGLTEELRQMSQQCIDNAWYPLQFGYHNKRGIHGACCLEVCHWFELGKFKYIHGMFFSQLGDKSILSTKLNGLAKMMGLVFKRQSDRNLPRTSFAKGLKKGKLMAHEMTGVLLVIAACLRSAKGQKLLIHESRGKQKQHFGSVEKVKDWILLIETMLQWHAWTGEPEMDTHVVERSKTKIREIMELEKFVGKREEGMGFNTFNFHGGLHVADDILDFGVPSMVNTRADEMGHKPTKNAAKQTQHIPDKFDMQVAQRLHDYELLALAMQELEGNKVWQYFSHQEEHDNHESEVEVTGEEGKSLRGTRAEYSYFGENESFYKVTSRMLHKNRFKFDPELDDWLALILDNLPQECNGVLKIYTEHNRWGTIFRASPYYRGKPWMDWANVDFGAENGGILPVHLWCFLDLRMVPEGSTDVVKEPGIYAICELTERSKIASELEMSDLFVPLRKKVGKKVDGKYKRDFKFVDVEYFHSPTCVIPDISNTSKTAYLQLEPKSEWVRKFEEWICAEHSRLFRPAGDQSSEDDSSSDDDD